ncbi:MAG: hypothetical protein R3F43_27195 [bacterium]
MNGFPEARSAAGLGVEVQALGAAGLERRGQGGRVRGLTPRALAACQRRKPDQTQLHMADLVFVDPVQDVGGLGVTDRGEGPAVEARVVEVGLLERQAQARHEVEGLSIAASASQNRALAGTCPGAVAGLEPGLVQAEVGLLLVQGGHQAPAKGRRRPRGAQQRQGHQLHGQQLVAGEVGAAPGPRVLAIEVGQRRERDPGPADQLEAGWAVRARRRARQPTPGESSVKWSG